MIFVTLGSQKFQFNRLLKEVDRLIEDHIIEEEVFAQIGYSDYQPKNYKYKQFLSREEFIDLESNADIVITHGWTGAIIGAVKKGKKVIAVPRLSKYGEHVDDHQMQLIEQFDGMGIIEACYESDLLFQAYNVCINKVYNSYISNTATIIENIENFLEEKNEYNN